MSRRLAWSVLALVAIAALAIGVAGRRGARTEDDRVREIAAQVRCPTCRGLSAAESDAKTAEAVRQEIRTRLRAGQSAGEIRAYLASRYGGDILLTPASSGFAALVWALPVAGLVLALAGLGYAFFRWREQERVRPPTPDERALVDDAMVNR